MHTDDPPNTSSDNISLGTDQTLPTQSSFSARHSEIELSIAHERLRQARRSFDLAWVTTAVCAFVGVGGVVTMMAGKTIPGSAATAGGVGATVYCLRLAKDANDRLDKLKREPKDD